MTLRKHLRSCLLALTGTFVFCFSANGMLNERGEKSRQQKVLAQFIKGASYTFFDNIYQAWNNPAYGVLQEQKELLSKKLQKALGKGFFKTEYGKMLLKNKISDFLKNCSVEHSKKIVFLLDFMNMKHATQGKEIKQVSSNERCCNIVHIIQKKTIDGNAWCSMMELLPQLFPQSDDSLKKVLKSFDSTVLEIHQKIDAAISEHGAGLFKIVQSQYIDDLYPEASILKSLTDPEQKKLLLLQEQLIENLDDYTNTEEFINESEQFLKDIEELAWYEKNSSWEKFSPNTYNRFCGFLAAFYLPQIGPF